MTIHILNSFQSRNRVSCDFCCGSFCLGGILGNQFQSRNRVSCDFCLLSLKDTLTAKRVSIS